MKTLKIKSINSIVFVFLMQLAIEISAPSSVLACGSFARGHSLFVPWMTVRSGVTDRGSILGQWSNIIDVGYNGRACPANTEVSSRVSSSRAPSGLIVNDGGENYDVYPTGVDNIGYYMRLSGPNDIGITFEEDVFRNAHDANFVRHQVKYVATGPLNPGIYTLPGRHVVNSQWRVTSNGAEVFSINRNATYSATRVTVTGATCAVRAADRNQQVVLPTVSRSSLQSVGSTAASQGFTIGVSCPPGVALHATMTDANFPDNRGNFLRLAGDSTAAGVGLQIRVSDRADVVSYGPDSRIARTQNQWFVGGNATSLATVHIIPFTVRYVRTGETLLPGTVRARSTITFSYQ
ncbi:type 1 fimbrial protein [Pseudomonas sp. PDM32]|uniref:fimbrial protein n=1 Tax=Pseudomonas sp. PDM32 TaxID=2854768 RepID=UPI001C47D3FB|nr:fimbrial protein [Pseudomonas sp. PDM32]MBV7576695.1 type 1 fimbrial protein [Pseudomonas sp. PDM32]